MENLNKYIDQTILRPSATKSDIMDFLHDVERYSFYAGVVNPCWVSFARKVLSPHIKVCSVVGFPLGASSTRTKVFATGDLIGAGCDEIDMVLNIGQLISKDFKFVGEEIRAVVDAADSRIVKVIIETCLLDDELKKTAARIIMDNGAHFVKTSTGFSREGAYLKDIHLLRQIVGPEFGIKASGGIRDHIFALELIKAGTNRIGTSAGVQIVNNYRKV
jgi:deoxyribose-phosphate aldolase